MTADEVQQMVSDAISTQQVLTITYRHVKDGRVTIHRVVPYSVEPGARSHSGRPMLWGYCLEHARLEQRIPENIILIEPDLTASLTDFQSAPARY